MMDIPFIFIYLFIGIAKPSVNYPSFPHFHCYIKIYLFILIIIEIISYKKIACFLLVIRFATLKLVTVSTCIESSERSKN